MSNAAVFPINMIRLCIDGYIDDLIGRAYNKMLLVPLPFTGYGGLLLGMDDLFEHVGFPQAFQVRRNFLEPEELKGSIHIPPQLMEDEEIDRQNGSCRTFDIIVQSRRQSGWQGLLMDTDRTHVKKFRSEMELLDYICQDLNETCGQREVPLIAAAEAGATGAVC